MSPAVLARPTGRRDGTPLSSRAAGVETNDGLLPRAGAATVPRQGDGPQAAPGGSGTRVCRTPGRGRRGRLWYRIERAVLPGGCYQGPRRGTLDTVHANCRTESREVRDSRGGRRTDRRAARRGT